MVGQEGKSTRPERDTCDAKAYAYIGGGEQVDPLWNQRMKNREIQRSILGHNVLFVPPQACKTDVSLEAYAAMITKINGASPDHGGVETCDLVTFGPNSVYFQHKVPFSGNLKPGHWSFKE